MSALVGAVELGGTKINVAVGTGPDDVCARAIIPTTMPGAALAAIIDFFSAHPAIMAVGVGSFGPVCLDPASGDWGSISATTKPGWSDTPVGRAIGDATGVPVALDTDVNAAALGETRWGALAGCAVGLYLTVGTGIGGGLVIGGVPLHGRSHPEMGHIRVKRVAGDDFAGVCPFHGDCIEGLASGPAIAARLGRSLSDVARDDAGRARVIDDLGQAVASLVLILSPHRIVIGGGVAKASGFHDDVTLRAKHWLHGYIALPDRFIVPPALGDDAGIAGCIALAHDRLDRRAQSAD